MNVRRRGARFKARQTGLTLIEILITLLVMSIGLLGVAGLHSFSMRNNFDALMRSQASALASDIADRMRASRALAYTGVGVVSDYTIEIGDGPPAVTAGVSQAIRDVNAWLTTLDAQLPSGDGAITIDQTTQIVTIEVQWGERGDGVTTGSVMSFVTETVI